MISILPPKNCFSPAALLLLLGCTFGNGYAQPLPPARSYNLQSIKSLPEVGIDDPYKLLQADAIIEKALKARAMPGCRVLAAKDGKIFYDKSFGYFDYSKKQKVEATTVYDLASLTKVVATTLAVMRLYEQGKIGLDKTTGDYLPFVRGTDKAGLKIRDLLMHQAGLKSWIPFYRRFYDSTSVFLSPLVYSRVSSPEYTVPVAANLFMKPQYRDTVWKMILESPLENKGRYVYSDLDFYFLAAIVEQVTSQPIDRYVQDQFYTPMFLTTIGYNPLQWLKPSHIAPTENDVAFRNQMLRGYVHDPGAALFGGVAGHAGVFASARNVAALFQMLLNEGEYRGKRYFRPETVRLFTAYNSAISRRGLGFDKPEPDANDGGPSGNYSSGYTFGHQGFTGTCAWADPATGVLFVFLSNRINPEQENPLLARMGTRTEVQDALYKALNLKQNFSRPIVKKEMLSR